MFNYMVATGNIENPLINQGKFTKQLLQKLNFCKLKVQNTVILFKQVSKNSGSFLKSFFLMT